ncbi:uncharacterized protein LOC122868655 isoform X2 [Siniperca chuatsi]|uniref:uncharacterized protein LOC122868655 isoform X2 n=1 Tax=Siniperca chuatsi TaxID=119488 RepID=UPI001CE065CF|nr:uncharacterized protein LOC122868655 isoform X2 [Siniperca chuatsi]
MQAQAALSSAIGLTMPQPTQHSLIHVLLLWTTILSIIQAVFIILFFTAGHHGLSQNSSAVAPERTMQFHTPSSPSEHELLLGKGKMLTFKATEANRTIKWVAKNPSKGLVSEEGDVLTIKKDGYYFLNLQVTLNTPPSGKETNGLNHTVSLKWNNKVLLQGRINTHSTCLLSKVQELSAGGTLVVDINLPTTATIDETESLTHLDIIYMVKP